MAGLPQLGPRTRKILYYVGLFVLAIVTFVFAAQATFPYGRVKAKLEELAAAKVDLTIENVERGIMPGVFYLEGVEIKTRPDREDLEKAYAITNVKEREEALRELTTTTYIDRVRVDIGLLGLISSTAKLDLRAEIGEGTVDIRLALSKDGTSIALDGDDVPSEQLPMRAVLSNLPMSGTVEFQMSLELPNEKLKTGKTGPNWERAVGEVEFTCPSGCTIGNGKARLKLKAKNERSQAFAGDGTEFGRVNIQSLIAKLEVRDGKLDITKFETKSSDVELYLDYSMTLAQNLDDSVVLGCVRFKGTEALRKREPKTYDQILLTGAARHTDGLDHILLKGTFKQMQKKPNICGPGIAPGDIDRPNLTVQPDEPVRPVPPPTPQINPPPPTPVDAAVDLATPPPEPEPPGEPSHDPNVVPSVAPNPATGGVGEDGSGQATPELER
jgi:type II secretion system protein N